MKEKDINNSKIEVINLDKVLDQALEHNSNSNKALKKILAINENDIVAIDEVLSTKANNLNSSLKKLIMINFLMLTLKIK